jgi:hypothetical protein
VGQQADARGVQDLTGSQLAAAMICVLRARDMFFAYTAVCFKNVLQNEGMELGIE